MNTSPFISVVLPTYKRPDLLRRAIASVRAQTFADWELIISDDERPAGAGFAVAVAASNEDARVRVVRNPGDPGQADNLNHACSLARGRWIKPLYDDDAFKPDCLLEFSRIAAMVPSAAMITCRGDRFVDGEPRAKGPSGPIVARVLRQEVAHLAMLMQDVQTGTPVQVMIRRRIFFDCGVRFPKSEVIVSGVDTLWNADILMHGDLVEIMNSLVDQHQGSHESITSRMTPESLFQEFHAIREYFWDRMPVAARAAGFVDVDTSDGIRRVRVPSLRVARSLQQLIHVAVLARRRRFAAAAARLVGVGSVSAVSHFVRWVRQQRDPLAHVYVPRTSLDAIVSNDAADPASKLVPQTPQGSME
jgi:glycosyltransferase involved in cell wall biosynthesis